MLLSHHPPSQYDRCIRVGGAHLCRRCAVLYPLALAAAVLSLRGLHWPTSQDRVWLFLLPLPMTLEFLLERFGALRYRAGRQILVTVIGAPALGRGFARYLLAPRDPLFWRMVLLFGGSSLLALLLTPRRDG